MARELYLPENKHISPKDGITLIRRCARIFDDLGSHPEIIELKYKIKIYQQKLKHLGISDY